MIRSVSSKLYLNDDEVSTDGELADIYRKRIQEFGFSGKAMFYKDEAQHQAKILQFATVLHGLVAPSDVLLDIGCGYGSLVPFLPSCRYAGIDLVPEFISHAQQQYSTIEFQVLSLEDYTKDYDWGILLGVVNGVPKPDQLIETAWGKCRKGLVVDFVRQDRLKDDLVGLNRFDISICLTEFLELSASKVEVYPTPNVWAIFVAHKVTQVVFRQPLLTRNI
jgi:2-polyprenyl-3-methyl-5-hydroxy-6-metoxy-1,4-benzoquinol methylase